MQKINKGDNYIKRKYIIEGQEYTTEDLRKAYRTLTGIDFDDEIYDKPLTDEEIYQYLVEYLPEE